LIEGYLRDAGADQQDPILRWLGGSDAGKALMDLVRQHLAQQADKIKNERMCADTQDLIMEMKKHVVGGPVCWPKLPEQVRVIFTKITQLKTARGYAGKANTFEHDVHDCLYSKGLDWYREQVCILLAMKPDQELGICPATKQTMFFIQPYIPFNIVSVHKLHISGSHNKS